jgi:hypothetical protein
MLIGSRCHPSSRSDLLPLNPFAHPGDLKPGFEPSGLAKLDEIPLHLALA